MAFKHHPSGRVARLALLALGLLTIIFTHSLVPSTDYAFAAQVTIAWDPDTSSGLTGYKIYWGTVSGNYSWSTDAGARTTYTVPSLSEGATYYFAATAYDATHTESGFSNEVPYTVPSACTYTTTPASQSIGAGGGTGTVTVTAGAGCNWTTSNSSPWISITSGASGTGNGAMAYSVAANAGTASRTAGLTIAGRTLMVSQAGGAQTYTLTISKSGSGSGTLTSSPTGTTFNAGTSVTLTATPGANSTFAGWSGACSGTSRTCTVTMTSNLSVAASFIQSQPSYTLTTTKSGSGNGTITKNPSGSTFKQGTTVRLTAQADKRSTFAGWSGACSGTSNTCTILMTGNVTATATFNSTKRYSYATH
jgi:uncharacterized repeat protein (TIGR02543 family)